MNMIHTRIKGWVPGFWEPWKALQSPEVVVFNFVGLLPSLGLTGRHRSTRAAQAGGRARLAPHGASQVLCPRAAPTSMWSVEPNLGECGKFCRETMRGGSQAFERGCEQKGKMSMKIGEFYKEWRLFKWPGPIV